MGAFTANAVGVGVVRTKYEGMLHRFFKKEFEVWNIRNYLTAISWLNFIWEKLFSYERRHETFFFDSGMLQSQQFSLNKFWTERKENRIVKKNHYVIYSEWLRKKENSPSKGFPFK